MLNMTRTYQTAVGCARGTMAWAVLAAGMISCPAVAEQQDAALRVTGPEVLVAAPDNSTGVFGWLRYSRHTGTEMLLISHPQRASDVADEGYCRWSVDNGNTWSQPVAVYHRNKPGQDASLELPSGRWREVPTSAWRPAGSCIQSSQNPARNVSSVGPIRRSAMNLVWPRACWRWGWT